MSIATVVTRGFGSFGTIPDVVRRGYSSGDTVVVVQENRGGGNRRRRIIRYSDFESREEYEKALRIAAAPILEAPIPITSLIDEDEETEAIFKLLMLMHDE